MTSIGIHYQESSDKEETNKEETVANVDDDTLSTSGYQSAVDRESCCQSVVLPNVIVQDVTEMTGENILIVGENVKQKMKNSMNTEWEDKYKRRAEFFEKKFKEATREKESYLKTINEIKLRSPEIEITLNEENKKKTKVLEKKKKKKTTIQKQKKKRLRNKNQQKLIIR
jgi:hypothetical protein